MYSYDVKIIYNTAIKPNESKFYNITFNIRSVITYEMWSKNSQSGCKVILP
jgi:hypothetical protein